MSMESFRCIGVTTFPPSLKVRVLVAGKLITGRGIFVLASTKRKLMED